MTRVLTTDQVDEAVELLAAGEALGVPTDTVYGIGARLNLATAVQRLFDLKKRPTNVALPVLIGEESQITTLEVEWSSRAIALAEHFWPGPLTIVVRANAELAARLGAVDTMGLRLPRHDLLRRLLRRSGPLAVTSANEHGGAPCHEAADVAALFSRSSALSAVIDAGRCDGVVSTVVDVSGDDVIVRRHGAIGEDDIVTVLSRG